jgi:hypothetical protein
LFKVYHLSENSEQEWIEIDDGQRGVGACLLHLYQLFVSKLGKLIHDREAAEVDRF